MNVHIADGIIKLLICIMSLVRNLLPHFVCAPYYCKCAGVKFMQSVPEGTYDAIILDAFVNIGIFPFLFHF